MSTIPFLTEGTVPRLPRPSGTEITENYIDQLVAALEETVDILNATRQRNFTEIHLTNTPTRGDGLRIGDVFSDSGILSIVRASVGYAGTLAGTASLGTVTIVTS